MVLWIEVAKFYRKVYGLANNQEDLERVKQDAMNRLYVDGNPNKGYTPNLGRKTSRGEGEKERLERAIQEIDELKKP